MQREPPNPSDTSHGKTVEIDDIEKDSAGTVTLFVFDDSAIRVVDANRTRKFVITDGTAYSRRETDEPPGGIESIRSRAGIRTVRIGQENA
jgi:hypothetical protein